MPRRKTADRVGPVKTRTRSGCKECRASRVRCDTEKPICTRCRERGLPCSTQLVLKWESEFVSRGLAFGRAGVWSKSKSKKTSGAGESQASPGPSSPASSAPSELHEWCPVPRIRPWGFVNSGVSTFEQPREVNVAGDEELNAVVAARGQGSPSNVIMGMNWPLSVSIAYYGMTTQASSGPSRSLSLFPDIPEANKGPAFEYYLQQVCPRTTASSTLSSPFASVILPFCLTASPTVFKAIQALGACHWSRSDPTHGAVGLRFKSQALNDLRRRLATEGPLACSSDPEVLVVMMMLCLYEIVDNCDEHWTVHLKGAKELIRLRWQQPESLLGRQAVQNPVFAFAELFFAFQDVMGRTACGEPALFGDEYWREHGRNIDLWMGCSPELVSILSSITEMSRNRRQFTSDPGRASFSLRATSLGRRLEHLVQEIDDGDDEVLQCAAELKRLASILYLHCALYGASPCTPLVADYVRKILRIVSDLLDRGPVVSMTWPVFVAAVQLDPAHDELWSGPDGEAVYGRPLVLRALAAMAESTVSNVTRTRAVVIKLWQARDGDMLKGSPVDGSRDWTSCNDWEWYVTPISAAMSLA